MTGSAAWLALLPALLLTGHTAVNARLLRRPRRDATTAERVAVLLPLRDEAARVAPCLRSLLAQRGVADLTVHVLDDGSTDGTAEVVRAVAGEAPGTRLRLHTGAPPPAGWLGKPHACHQLARLAGDADVLVFVDADVVLRPDAVAGAVDLLRRAGVALLSPYPKIVGAGRLVQPLLQWSWLTFLPLRGMERSARASLAAAGGQWLVLDRAGYRAAGGHAAVRAEILEDIALARAVKRAGGRIALADGSRLATCRMYDSWRELADGYAKSLWASFGSAAGAAAVVVLLLLLYALPPLAALVPGYALVALLAYLLGVTGRVISARATGGRVLPDALAHPLSIALFAWLVARSFHLRRRRRLAWRGRALP
ncbi:glycosyltransferase [Actinoplanes teichomyceticus]|uniref:Cellulose synthase/poly-beta-1,6-N-acetylglucosamine synthase-like glycosyltransferase n=1 Tax=Actinoplanes teichomyceticus TaxID=1867 RepID=A0A561WJ18_ACTTI|nr:glycosyltransferase [Actinoplanes teichomyceticus]TWG23848.1 cellulose synthase/poly-beta-1,6-N-acetylglucosamine synthase-like glycosyltransferase [Actinoplanes teichomyceticus]GIF11892.1 glycosyl transferase [Actinoplanes teichomyceticus]